MHLMCLCGVTGWLLEKNNILSTVWHWYACNYILVFLMYRYVLLLQRFLTLAS